MKSLHERLAVLLSRMGFVPAMALDIGFASLVFMGVILAFVPFMPALSFMAVVSVVFSLVTQFEPLSGGELSILVAISIVSIATDFLSGLFGAKMFGAHGKSIFIGMTLSFIGFFIFPPLGGIIGLFLGVFISEMVFRSKSVEGAVKSAKGAVIGTVVGMIINIILAILFFSLFILFIFI